jgi:hypothetical protein
MLGGNVMPMARDQRDLKRLADELASLTAEERASVLADVARRRLVRPLPRDFRPPVFKDTGGRWIGGTLRREDIYGDDGR